MNKQQLAAKIWQSANEMRSKIEANEYKDYILGFIFYKYLSDKEVQFAKSKDFSDEDLKTLTEEDTETAEYFRSNIGYFIGYADLFSTWIKKGKDFDVSNVRDALSAFNRLISKEHKKLFEGIFETLQTGLSKLGESAAAQTKAISGLLQLIKDIPMDAKQDYDVLGFIYEYLISMFAANAGKKAGEFYTPHEVSLVMSEIVAEHLKHKKDIQIYDPTSGSGSLLINIGKCVSKHIDDKDTIKYYAQELKRNTYNLTRMNLIMRGIIPSNIETRNGDTLEEDWPYFNENDPINTYDPLYVDAVVSNPPYSQKWDSTNKESDPRYARFGLAPKTKADYAFLLHDLYHVKPDGIMAIVLPHGVLFRGGEEGKIRENLIESNHIDTIIGLPPNIFFGTGIPTIIMVLKQKRSNTDVLIIDASKGFVKEGTNNKLRASDIKKIVDTVTERASVEKYSKLVEREEIRNNEYNLNIPRYVDSNEETESWDIYASMFGGIPTNEIHKLSKYWAAFPKLKAALFTPNSDENMQLNTDDIKATITEDSEIQEFMQTFTTSFADFKNYLTTELVANPEAVQVTKQKNTLSIDIFKRLENFPLIDKYEAYQLLDDEWNKIEVDLEIIQTETMAVAKKVEPNMVFKKKSGKDVEVQEGWKGRIMPFELVQQTLLKDNLDSLQQKENRLTQIEADYTDLFESLSEEDKESEVVNDAKTSFTNSAVTKEAKKLEAEVTKNGAFPEESLESKILKVSKLITEEKELKKVVSTESAQLHELIKTTIENLTDGQVTELLEKKWIAPLITSLNQLPQVLIDTLTTKVQALADKYATTYASLNDEIKQTETELASLIDELTGSDTDIEGLNAFKSFLAEGLNE